MNKEIVEIIAGAFVFCLIIEAFLGPIAGIIEAWRRKL